MPRSLLVISSIACTMAFGGSASPLHALPNGRGASLSPNPSTAASDEWTAGFVFQSSPARAPKRRGRGPKRNQARKSQTALLATKLHGGESPPASGPATALGAAASAWGALGVLYILLNPVKRLLPIALLPFKGGAAALGPAGWCAYAGFVCFMAFFEGYKGFQVKDSSDYTGFQVKDMSFMALCVRRLSNNASSILFSLFGGWCVAVQVFAHGGSEGGHARDRPFSRRPGLVDQGTARGIKNGSSKVTCA